MHLVSIALSLLLAVGCSATEPQRTTAPVTEREDGYTVTRDLSYADPANELQRADVFVPEGPGPFPAVLVVHGGSWQRGEREDIEHVAATLAERGFVAVNLDYRLAPQDPFPAQLDDLRTAVRWTRRDPARWRVDPERIGAFGYSAGGHLVALLATTGDDDPSGRIQAAVLGAAPTDLLAFEDVPTFHRFLGGSRTEVPERYVAASPLTHVTADDPPMFLYHGRNDWLVDVSHTRKMVAALDRERIPHEYVEGGHGHFGTFVWDDEELERATRFLRRWLGGTDVAERRDGGSGGSALPADAPAPGS